MPVQGDPVPTTILSTTGSGSCSNDHSLYLSSVPILNTETDSDPGDIMGVVEHDRNVKVSIDSGAARSVIQRRHCTDHQAIETNDSKTGVVCGTDAGPPVRDDQIWSVVGYPHDGKGTFREAKFRGT